MIGTPDPVTIDMMVAIAQAAEKPMSVSHARLQEMQDELAAHVRSLHEKRRAERMHAAAVRMNLRLCECGGTGWIPVQDYYDPAEYHMEHCPVCDPPATDEDYERAASTGLAGTDDLFESAA